MRTIKTKEPKLAPKSEYSTMRENAARIESGRATIAEQKKIVAKAKRKATMKKVAGIAAASAVGSLGLIGRRPTPKQRAR